MVAFDILGPEGKKAGTDLALNVRDSAGNDWTLENDGTNARFYLKRNGTAILTIESDGGVTLADGGLRIPGSSRLRESMSVLNITTAGAGTLTAAGLVGGVITRDPSGASRTDTTATGTEIDTELAAQGMDAATGDTFVCWLINTADAAETITLAGGTDVTISNVGQTVAQNEAALLLFRRTGANTYTCYVVGA